VVHVLKPLKMFVRFAVQLEIRLQVGLVSAEFAHVVTSYNGQNLLFPDLGSICGQMVR
jgi:carbohydrate-selective porin OprB